MPLSLWKDHKVTWSALLSSLFLSLSEDLVHSSSKDAGLQVFAYMYDFLLLLWMGIIANISLNPTSLD
jgi:hypothetical protein